MSNQIFNLRKAGFKLSNEILANLDDPKYLQLRTTKINVFYAKIHDLMDFFDNFTKTHPENVDGLLASSWLLDKYKTQASPYKNGYIVLLNKDLEDLADCFHFSNISFRDLFSNFYSYSTSLDEIIENKEPDVTLNVGQKEKCVIALEENILKTMHLGAFGNYQVPKNTTLNNNLDGLDNLNTNKSIIEIAGLLAYYSQNYKNSRFNDDIFNKINNTLNACVDKLQKNSNTKYENIETPHTKDIMPFANAQCFKILKESIADVLSNNFSQQNPIAVYHLLSNIKNATDFFVECGHSTFLDLKDEIDRAFIDNSFYIEEINGLIVCKDNLNIQAINDYLDKSEYHTKKLAVSGAFSLYDTVDNRLVNIDLSKDNYITILQRPLSKDEENIQTLIIQDELTNQHFLVDFDLEQNTIINAEKILMPLDKFLFLHSDVDLQDEKIFENFNKPSLEKSFKQKLSSMNIPSKLKAIVLATLESDNNFLGRIYKTVKDLYMNKSEYSLKDLLSKKIFSSFFGNKKENNRQIIAFRHREIASHFTYDLSSEQERIKEYAKIAANLAMSNGFLGSVAYNTLQHSINTMKILKGSFEGLLAKKGYSQDKQNEILLQALLHDAVEATHLGDIPTPIKKTFPELYKYEELVTKNLYNSLGINKPDKEAIKLIDIADKMERNTFIQLQFKNPKYFADAFNIYVADEIESKRGSLLSGIEIDALWQDIIKDYKAYIQGSHTFNNPHSQKFFTKFGLDALDKKYFALSVDEYKKFDIDMTINKSPEETLLEFAKIMRDFGINISDDLILQSYAENQANKLDLDKLDIATTTIKQLAEATEIINNRANEKRHEIETQISQKQGVSYGL